jgi:hypothetical protein
MASQSSKAGFDFFSSMLSAPTISTTGALFSPVMNPRRRAPRIAARTCAFHKELLFLDSFSETGWSTGVEEALTMADDLLRFNLLRSSDYHEKRPEAHYGGTTGPHVVLGGYRVNCLILGTTPGVVYI